MTAGRFYFAFPRLVELLNGRSAARAERDRCEAYFGGVAVFAVTYATLNDLFAPESAVAVLLLVLPLLLATWILWLILFYANSLAVAFSRMVGLLRGLTKARAQSVIICTETTLLAVLLAQRHHAAAIVAWIWLAAVALNALSALTLATLRRSRDA